MAQNYQIGAGDTAPAPAWTLDFDPAGSDFELTITAGATTRTKTLTSTDGGLTVDGGQRTVTWPIASEDSRDFLPLGQACAYYLRRIVAGDGERRIIAAGSITTALAPVTPLAATVVTGPQGPAGAGNPGGTSGQLQVNFGGSSFHGVTVSGDGTLDTSTGALAIGKIGGKAITLGGAFTTAGAYAATLTLTGTTNVTVPTTGTLATTANITAAINALINSAPGALDTLEELADALGDDANFAATMTAALASKQPLDATLTALAALTTAANKLIYATGADTFATTDLSTYGRSLIDDADAATARGTLGLAALAVLASVDLTANVTGILPSANGGVDTSAWSTWSPTVSVVTPGGTPPVFSILQARYKRIGKTVWYSAVFGCTSIGTGTGDCQFTLPSTPGYYGQCTGENVSTDHNVTGKVSPSSATVPFTDYGGSVAFTTGEFVQLAGFYEEA